MKKLIIAILACLPLMSMAQDNVWEVPDDQPAAKAKVQKKKAAKPKKVENPKYLAGAVPEVDGKVVFTLDKDVPGMNAQDIYDKVYGVFEQVVDESKSEDIIPPSRISAVNKGEHSVAARINEWLVFSNKFLSLDRTQFTFTLIAEATNGHVNVTMSRIGYAYEVGRDNSSGLKVSAEEWITDEKAIKKNGVQLAKGSAKFRRKTIDRKDNIFGRICKALGVEYK